MIVKVNAKEFVDWLLHLPPMKRMKPMRATDVISVGRRLAELAHAKPELSFLSGLAFDVWRLLVHLPQGKVASNSDCIRFLENFAPYLPSHDLKAAVRTLRRTSGVKTTKIDQNPNQLEYRTELLIPFAPAAFFHPKRSKRPPVDDISERIGVSAYAMTKARCTHPITYVANALKKSEFLPGSYCTVSHVGSRIKKLGVPIPLTQQDVFPWLFAHWHNHYPGHASKAQASLEWPESFVFKKCDC